MNSTARNTEEDLLLPNTVSQKDEKGHTAGLNDTAIPYFKIKITEIPLEKKKTTTENKKQNKTKQKTTRYRNLTVFLFHLAKRINHPDSG